jgi:3-hydroxyacyl-CoA dehydrogenase/enoyl-CoA hydratase/3-hydroxybutyryl-CoA epimerase
MSNTISYNVEEDGIATIVIDIKDRKMNVATAEFMDEFGRCIDTVAGDSTVVGAVVTSGKSSFFAGADLKELVGVFDGGMSRDDILKLAGTYSGLYRKLETSGKPWVAAINGTALGAGLELCLACHHRVALDHPKSVLGLPEVMVGLLPGAGGTQRLSRLIGIREALPLMLEGRHIPARKAVEIGIADQLASDAEDMMAKARRWILDGGDHEQPWDKKGFKVPGGAGAMNPKAVETFMVGTSLLAGKTQHNYPAAIAIMSAVYEGTILPMDKALKIEVDYFTSLLTGPVARNMIRTLFIDKGAADKLVRRPQGVEKSSVNKLGVLGAGMMGAGIAYVSARSGQQVVLLDSAIDSAEKGKDYSRKLVEKQISRGRMDKDAGEALLGRIHPTIDYADLEGCELVIEAVFEDRAIKADVTARTEAVIPEDAIFASNTSTLPITGLAEASKRPEQFIGIHFFSPVDKMPLVEIILGEKTGDVAIARAMDYVRQIRKTPILVRDSRGFYTSRCFATFVKEGMELLAEGVKPALIENVARMAGMPVGPLAVHDEVTIDLSYKILKQTQNDLGENYAATASDDVVRHFVEDLKRSGKRFGAGFYDYPEDGKKHLWPGLAEEYPAAEVQPDVEEIKKRLLYIQSLETARCMEEGVVPEPADADVGSILGWGFPPWTGGTLSLIDTLGVDEFVAECERMAAAYGPRFQPSDWLRNKTAMSANMAEVSGEVA